MSLEGVAVCELAGDVAPPAPPATCPTTHLELAPAVDHRGAGHSQLAAAGHLLAVGASRRSLSARGTVRSVQQCGEVAPM